LGRFPEISKNLIIFPEISVNFALLLIYIRLPENLPPYLYVCCTKTVTKIQNIVLRVFAQVGLSLSSSNLHVKLCVTTSNKQRWWWRYFTEPVVVDVIAVQCLSVLPGTFYCSMISSVILCTCVDKQKSTDNLTDDDLYQSSVAHWSAYWFLKYSARSVLKVPRTDFHG